MKKILPINLENANNDQKPQDSPASISGNKIPFESAH
jgi:hypothetical protein